MIQSEKTEEKQKQVIQHKTSVFLLASALLSLLMCIYFHIKSTLDDYLRGIVRFTLSLFMFFLSITLSLLTTIRARESSKTIFTIASRLFLLTIFLTFPLVLLINRLLSLF
jgi:hypothetical protein